MQKAILLGASTVTLTALALTRASTPTLAATFSFAPDDLVISRSVYAGTAATVTVGQTLPGSTKPAVANGLYPGVFNNAIADSSFGITSPIFLDQLTTAGTLVGTLAIDPGSLTTSFPSKSELALNLTADGSGLTFLGYATGINQLDVSNSNTPGILELGNPVTTTPTYRAVAQVQADGSLQTTTTNAYAGNNGRAVILAANGLYYAVGNAGNGDAQPRVTALSTAHHITARGWKSNRGT